MKNTLEKYCASRAYKNIHVLNPETDVHPIGICIPIHNEYPSFFSTLRSLHLSALSYLAQIQYKPQTDEIVKPVSIICCVNAHTNDELSIRENNAKMLYELLRLIKTEYDEHPLFNLIIIDYTSDGHTFAPEDGAGLARKIAMDYAVIHDVQVLACLDADTLVSTSYISCLEFFYNNTVFQGARYEHEGSALKSSWALTGFTHQKGETDEHENAIRMYESYLLEHSKKLARCGTPYYPVALGPTIVCTSQAYAECGGMNTRRAGEDFYFLQALIKLHVHDDIQYFSCRVFPSARISDRVLFGTGKKIKEIMEGKDCRVFNAASYETLRKFILFFTEAINKSDHREKNKNPMEEFVHEVSLHLSELMPFLEQDGFFNDLEKISVVHSKSKQNLVNAFHDRFDGLKIVRLFHFLESIKQ